MGGDFFQGEPRAETCTFNAEQKLSDRGALVLLWDACSKCRANVNSENKQQDDSDMTNTQVLATKKTDLLEEFFSRYDWRLPLDLTPSEATFQILARVHSRRSLEFIPLSRVSSAADTRDVTVDHVRIKGTNGDLLIDPARSLNKRNSDFNKNNDTFNHSVKILMYGYVLVSCADNREAMWCPLQSAMKHITTVENQSRIAARLGAGLNSKIAEAEMTVRREWREVGQAEPSFSLATVIELVCQRHSIWPSALELRTVQTRVDAQRSDFFGQRSDYSGKQGKGFGKKGSGKTSKGNMSLADKKWHAKQSGLTVMEPELCDKFSTPEGCRMTNS